MESRSQLAQLSEALIRALASNPELVSEAHLEAQEGAVLEVRISSDECALVAEPDHKFVKVLREILETYGGKGGRVYVLEVED